MTHTELAELATTPEGRRTLDAMAAERVMGWAMRNHRGPDDEYTSAWHNADGSGGLGVEEWSPTSSIADAWQLVEVYRKAKHRVQITVSGDRTVCFIDLRGVEHTQSACNESPELAITIAALLAVDQKEKA